jgi:hypothetical protein
VIPAGIEPAIPASEQPQTHALDRAATGISSNDTNHCWFIKHMGLSRNIHFSQQQQKKVNSIGPIFQDQAVLEMGPSGCPETSVTNYQHTPPNIPLKDY